MIDRVLALMIATAPCGLLLAAPTPAQIEFFEQRIRPALVEHCYRCHSADAERVRGGLRLDSLEGLLRGGETGPAIDPGAAVRSLLYQAITYEDPDLQMPPKSRLRDDEVASFKRWLDEGAAWPTALDAERNGDGVDAFDLAARRASHWAWQPVRPTEPPPVRDAAWAATPVDRFILAGLEAAGLDPAAPADQRALIRRVHFVLTGLPPSPAEVEAFVRDASEDALVGVVDRLLASPHFGERWGRHWLDKVRYAETLGHEFDYPILGAWRYRDYVVRAFNGDVPFDAFAREQIAGDLMEDPRRNPEDGVNESLLGTTQYWLGQQVHSPVDVRHHQLEFIDNQIDVLTKSFLGMTVSCARCHDHKFDAISIQDYYGLYGVLASSRPAIRAVDDPATRHEQAAALRARREILRQLLAIQLDQRIANGEDPGPLPDIRLGLRANDNVIQIDGWFADGEAFTADAGATAQPMLLGSVEAPRLGIVRPGWRNSASLSRRFQGALRSPAFVLNDDFLHLQVAGEGARVNVVIEGFTLIRAPIYGPLRQALRNPDPHWITIDVAMWRGRRAWIELADFSAPDPASELGAGAAGADGWAAVGAVIASADRDPPALLPGELPPDPAETVRRWASAPSTLSLDEAAMIEALLAGSDVKVPDAELETYRSIESTITEPALVWAMTDADGWDEPVFIRGNHRTTGEPVPRRFLEALADYDPGSVSDGSGRRELADAMVHPDNPLFARVTVNWVWAQVFGRGLVSSVDNFGALGELPTHPGLLNWLATDFRRSGWSIKHLIRQLVLSQTWQMSSAGMNGQADELDPDNALLHRAHLRRLDGESIRDKVLALSGRLDPRMGGPSVPVHLTSFMDGRGRPRVSGPLDGDGRRSLYLEVRRNFLSPMMLAFDTPVPASTVGIRTVSNVPAQALILMNDPFVAEQARLWAGRLLGEVPGATAARVSRAYREAFAREPSPDELAAAEAFLMAQGVRHGDDMDAAWADYCHALFNLKEFLFLD